MSSLSDITRRSLANMTATLQRAQQGGALHELALDDLVVVSNVRGTIDEATDDFADFVENVTRHGVQQPVLVRPSRTRPGKYELIAGERRWRASRAAGRKTIPAIVKHVSDAEVVDIQLLENYQRENLTMLQEAVALKAMLDAEGSLEKVADKWRRATNKRSVSKSWVSERLQLLDLQPPARGLIEDNVTSDIAVINSVNRAAKLDPEAAAGLAAQVRRSDRKRETARKGLDEVKGRAAGRAPTKGDWAREAARLATGAANAEADGREDGAGKRIGIPVSLQALLEAAHAAGAGLAIGGLSALASSVALLEKQLEKGDALARQPAARRLVLMAFALGTTGRPLDPQALVLP